MHNRHEFLKRALSLCLVVLMIVTLIPNQRMVFAAENTKTFQVVIQTQDGVGIANAEVTIAQSHVQTDERGVAEIQVSGSSFTYAIQAKGFASKSGTVKTSGKSSVTVKLEALQPRFIQGKVIAESQGLEGVEVTAMSTVSDEINGTDTVMTDADGSFRLTVYEMGTYQVKARKEGFLIGTASVLVQEEEAETEAETVQEDDSFETSEEVDETEEEVQKGTDCYDAGEIVLQPDHTRFVFDQPTAEVIYSADQAPTVTGVQLSTSPELQNGVLEYASSDTDVLAVNEDGTILTKKPGTADITVIRKEDETYLEKTAAYTVVVRKMSQKPLTWKKTENVTLFCNQQYTNTASGGTTKSKITYTSSDESVAVVSSKGVVTGKKAGTVTITATRKGDDLYEDAVAVYQITYQKLEDAWMFAQSSPKDLVVEPDQELPTLQNPVTGENLGEITYTVENLQVFADEDGEQIPAEEANIATVDANGTVTATGTAYGKVRITASRDPEQYEKDAVSYDLTVRSRESRQIFFETSEPGEIVYGETFQNPVDGQGVYTYRSSDETIAKAEADGTLDIQQAGTVTITATAEDGTEISYDLTIVKAVRTVSWTADSIDTMIYAGEYAVAEGEQAHTYVIQETGDDVASAANIQISSSDASVLKIVNGQIQAVGVGTVTLTIAVPEDTRYEASQLSCEVTVMKATPELIWKKGAEVTETYKAGFHYVNPADRTIPSVKGEELTLEYHIVSGEDVISGFDETDGSFDVEKAGTVVIKAIYSASQFCESVESTYSLHIEKAVQEIGFKQEQYKFTAGAETAKLSDRIKDGLGEASIQYSFDNKDVIEKIEEDGTIHFTGYPGEVVITAVKPEDDRYCQASDTCTITVGYSTDTKEHYTLEGDQKNGKSKWYTGAASVKAAKGYQVAEQFEGVNTTWSDCIENIVTEDSNPAEITFYVRKESNPASVQQVTKEIYLDQTTPQAELQMEESTIWEKAFRIISFGKLGKDTVTVDLVEVSDGEETLASGVASKEYFIGTPIDDDTLYTRLLNKQDDQEIGELVEDYIAHQGGWQTWTGALEFEKDTEFVVYAKVTDVAGNALYTSTNGVIFESSSPVVTVSIIPEEKTEDDFYNTDVHLKIFADDTKNEKGSKTVSSGIQSVTYTVYYEDQEKQDNGSIISDGETTELWYETDERPQTVIWESNDSEEYPYITVETQNDFTKGIRVEVTVTDYAGNVGTGEIEFNMDTVKPAIQVDWQGDARIVADSVEYYAGTSERIAQISITERSFDPDTATKSIGVIRNGEELSTEEIQNLFVKNEEESIWTESGVSHQDSTVHDAKMRFTETGTYQLYVKDYADKAGNSAEVKTEDGNQYQSALFVVDATDPTVSKLAVSEDTAEDAKPLAKCSESGLDIYRGDVVVGIQAEEPYPEYAAGIKQVEYWVTSEDVETQRAVLYAFEEQTPTYDQLRKSWSGQITVDAAANNSCDVKVYVKVTDNAGNTFTAEPLKLDIDNTDPKIQIAYDNNDGNREENGRGYFGADRTATITVTERSAHFNAPGVYDVTEGMKDAVEGNGILLTAVDSQGDHVALDLTAMTENGNWTQGKGENVNEDTHTLAIHYRTDANYTFEIAVTDQAGRKTSGSAEKEDAGRVDTTGSTTPYIFTVDQTAPLSHVKVDVNEKSFWTELVDTITFGLWKKEPVEVTGAAGDATSPVTIEYFTTTGMESFDRLTREEKLVVLSQDEESSYGYHWITVNQVFMDAEAVNLINLFTSQDNQQFVTYLKATDYAGQVSFASTDGVLADQKAPQVTTLAVSQDTAASAKPLAKCEESGLDIYRGNVVVDIQVDEPNATYAAGIRQVEYWVTSEDVETQRAVLYDFNYQNTESGRKLTITDSNAAEPIVLEGNVPVYEQLRKNWNGQITVDAAANNSCDVKVYVKVTDNAGNEDTSEPLKLDIDYTNPEIQITYDNNEANQKDAGRGYFGEDRTATIIVTERSAHFNAPGVYDVTEGMGNAVDGNSILLTAVDGQGNHVVIDVEEMTEDWITETAEDSNEDTHTLTIHYNADANYTFGMAVTDQAGRMTIGSAEKEDSGRVNTTNSTTPYVFTVDHTAPLSLVKVDVNEKSFWTGLVETITFGLWKKEPVEVMGTAGDVTSPVTIEYFTTTGIEAFDRLSKEEKLAVLTQEKESGYGYQWTGMDQIFTDAEAVNLIDLFSSEENQQFVTYLKATDYAGQVSFASTDGVLADNRAPQVTTLAVSKDTADAAKPLAKCRVSELDIYRGDVVVDIQVDEPNATYAAGIRQIEYWVTSEGVETQRETLYDFAYQSGTDGSVLTITDINQNGKKPVVYEGNVPTYSQLRKRWSGQITVDAEKNNSCDVKVYVKVTDNAGNTFTAEPLKLDIDHTDPSIQISYDNNEAHRVADGRGYFGQVRRGTITVTERSAHFNAPGVYDVTEGMGNTVDGNSIFLTAVDSRGVHVPLDVKGMIGNWVTEKAEDSNEDTHTISIRYSTDANYTFGLTVTDQAGRKTTGNAEKEDTKRVDTMNSTTPYVFTVDRTAPVSNISVEVNERHFWTSLVETITFGLWKQEPIQVSATAGDETSCPVTLAYFTTTGTEAFDTLSNTEKIAALDRLGTAGSPYQYSWRSVEKTFYNYDAEQTREFVNLFSSNMNNQLVVYLRATDYAGNVWYSSTNGFISEAEKPVITLTASRPSDYIYNENDSVEVNVNVIDPVVNGTYSGIKEISYVVRNLNAVTHDKDVLYEFTIQNPEDRHPTRDELLQSWNRSIVVNKEQNNSNEVEVEVTATDNAGNTQSERIQLKIDITKPDIQVSYQNNAGDTTFGKAYFKEDRVATVTITERNFDPSKVKFEIANTNGVMPSISGWSTVEGGGNKDNTLHIATVTYGADGDYTFDVSCQDEANNANTDVEYGGSLAPKEFTIDKTAPVIHVDYDNTSAKNGNYYNAVRTATISITEHNFETSRIVVNMTATDDGRTIAAPSVSGWSRNGDVNTATVTYAADGLYTFDIDYQDMAGNPAQDMAEEVFYVDQTKPVVTVTNIVDQSANAEKGNIGFVITATDTNFDVFQPVLTAIVQEDGKFVRKTLDVGTFTDINNGSVFTVENLSTDGIYYLSCTVVDKAGNAYDEIVLYDSDGKEYTKPLSEEDPMVKFSIVRNGSAYELGTETEDLVNQYYVQDVYEDLIIMETNTDPIDQYEITLNGKVLNPGIDYSVVQQGGDVDWNHNTYTISRSLFAEEGEYQVVLFTKDKAGTDAFTDVEGAKIAFVVDQKAPEVVVTGLEDNGRYQVEKQTVSVVPVDDGGALQSILVQTVDEDGKALQELLQLSGEELEETLESQDGKLQFDVASGLYQNVQIICNDRAIDENGKTNEYNRTIKNVSISSNMLMIFWANKPARYGTAAGGSAAAIAIALLAILKKKKVAG
ncbi:MAG: Ig-like domain-containing protein [Lachnospiraceae bacterium]|nr:Ig-like domain-containing protein [Lachnospiraceae bacterium]